jgi:hypothetical protein
MGIDVARFRNDADMGVVIGNFANEMTALYVSRGDQMQFRDDAVSNGLGPPTRLPCGPIGTPPPLPRRESKSASPRPPPSSRGVDVRRLTESNASRCRAAKSAGRAAPGANDKHITQSAGVALLARGLRLPPPTYSVRTTPEAICNRQSFLIDGLPVASSQWLPDDDAPCTQHATI